MFLLVRSFASVSMIGECLRVDERSSDSYVGHDDFFQEKSLPLRQARVF